MVKLSHERLESSTLLFGIIWKPPVSSQEKSDTERSFLTYIRSREKMKQHTSLTGIYPVVPTPLLDDESFDARTMGHLIDHYVETGCHGLVVLGSGGELPCFTAAEKITILETALDAARGRIPIIAGCGYVSLA
jgi:hypothetical protein